MAIRWEDIQNLTVTNSEINKLAGLTADSSDINKLDGFTGTTQDLNDGVGATAALAAHEALDFIHGHALIQNSLDGLLIVDDTIPESKLSFDVATQVEIDLIQSQVTDLYSDNAVQQGQIDNLYSIVIPGQGDDLAEAIQQTIAHIENPTNAHDSSAISYGNNYSTVSDLSVGATELTVDPSIVKMFRAGEGLKFQDDETESETTIITSVDYNTNIVSFNALLNSYSATAENAVMWILSEDTVKEGLDRALRNNTDILTGRLTINQDSTDHSLVLSQLGSGDELHFTTGIVGSDTGYDFELEDGVSFSINHDVYGESFLVDTAGDGYLTQLLLREDGTAFHGTLTKNITADREWSFRDLDNIIGNPDMAGNALKYLRVNAGETDTEWIIISAAEVTYDNSVSELVAVEVQSAIDEIDGIVDTHIADTTNPHSVTVTQAVTADTGTDITVAEMETLTDGSNADLLHDHDHQTITGHGVHDHTEIDTHLDDITIHRSINDIGVATTDLWSADKIQSELSAVSGTIPQGIDDLDDVDTTTTIPVAGEQLTWDGANWIPGASGEINTASNKGVGEGSFASKVGSDLQFKTLIEGTDISISSTSDEITINSTTTASNIGSEAEVYKQKTGSDFEFRTLIAGDNIVITENVDTIEIMSTASGGGTGGTAISRVQSAHSFIVLDAIYHDGTEWKKAQANSPDTLAEYVVTEVADVDNFTAYKFGEATITSHGLSVGEHFFLSEITAGGHIATEPSSYSSPLFYVEDANTIHIEVYRPSEVSGAIDPSADSIIVGSVADVAGGIADYSTLQEAHDVAADGETIDILKTAVGGNTTITKRLTIMGQGNISELTGTLQFSTGGAKTLIKYLKFSGNVAIDDGVTNIIMTDCWAGSTVTITDNNTVSGENLITIMQEA